MLTEGNRGPGEAEPPSKGELATAGASLAGVNRAQRAAGPVPSPRPAETGLRQTLHGPRWGLVTATCGLGRTEPRARHVPLGVSIPALGPIFGYSNRVPTQQGCQMALLPRRKAALLGQPFLLSLRLAALASASGIKARQPLILG